MAGGTYTDDIPQQGNEVLENDLPAMLGNFRVLADVLSGVTRAGGTAPAGWINAWKMDLPTGSTPTSTSGMGFLRVNTASGVELQVRHVASGVYRRVFVTRVSGASAFLTLDSDPVNASDAATRGWTEGAISAAVAAGLATLSLDDLDDVDVAGATSGQVLTLSGSTWIARTVSGGGGGNLEDLDDVVYDEPPTGGQVLRYDDGLQVWSAEDPVLNSIDDAGDVSLSSPVTGDMLRFNGAAWENVVPDVGTNITIGGFPVVITSLTDGDILVFNSGAGEWQNQQP
jgi:hypothetical protein